MFISRRSRSLKTKRRNPLENPRAGRIAWLTLVAAIAAAGFGGYAVYQEYWRAEDKASLVVQRILSGPFEDSKRVVMSIAAGIDNQGTEAITLRQFNWVLSATPDPKMTVQRRMRWTRDPETLIVAEGGEYTPFEVNINGRSSWLVEGQNFCQYALSGVPPEVRDAPGFMLQYWSNLVIYFEDSRSRLHEVIVPLGDFWAGLGGGQPQGGGFSTYYGAFEPITIELFPSPVRDSARDRRFFSSPIGSLVPSGTDTTGWRFHRPDGATLTYREWEASESHSQVEND